jgi:uncharacterized membrane protein
MKSQNQKQKSKNQPVKPATTIGTTSKPSKAPQLSITSEWLMVWGITLLAFVLRIWGVGRFSFWFDEYLHLIPAKEFIEGKGLHHIDGNNGIFTTYVEVVFLFLFGQSELAGRLPMVLFSSLTVPVLYLFTRRLFNQRVAFMTIFIFSISLYSIFWGRVVRNYATFLPFYLLFCDQVLRFLEPSLSKIGGGQSTEVHFSKKWLLAILGLFLLSIINHPFTIFIVFVLAFYGTAMWVIHVIKEEGRKRFLNKYTIFILGFGVIGFILTPQGNVFFSKLLGGILPQNMMQLIVPDIVRLKQLWAEEPFKALGFYWDIIQSDTFYTYVLAALGLLIGLRKFTKSGVFVGGHFIFLLFMMSFVFREVTLTRYLYFIYPFYLMLFGLGLIGVAEWLTGVVFKKTGLMQSGVVWFIMLFAVVLVSQPSTTKAFLNRQQHGQLVDRKIGEWYFSHWRDALKYVQQNMKEGDVILSTVPNAPRWYLGTDTSSLGWFRQRHYDGTAKDYVPNDPDGKRVSGYTTEQFIKTIEDNPRGWLLADYYFYNRLTDDNARQYATENLTFHFNASADGSVQVFSWDKSNPKKTETPVFIEIGKPLSNSFESPDLPFSLALAELPETIRIVIDVEGISMDNQLVARVNDVHNYFIKKPENSRGWGTEFATFEVPKSALVEGQNKLKFIYNYELNVNRPGVVIYNVRMY